MHLEMKFLLDIITTQSYNMKDFLLAEDPLEIGEEFILHTHEPRCLIRVIRGPFEEAFLNKFEDKKGYTRELTGENFILAVADNYDYILYSAEEMEAALDRAARWYVNYLSKLDKDILNEDQITQN